MTVVAILNDYQHAAMGSVDWGAVQSRAEVRVFDRAFSDIQELAAELKDVEVLCVMRERLPITAEVLDALPSVRCIVTTGAGNRAIDLAAARARGVVVSGTTNGMGRVATAELTWGLVLALARRIPQEDRAIRDGHWQTVVGTPLHGKTLGLVGLGGVGRHLARYARAFGMEVIAWSRNLDDERALESLVERVDFDDLIARSDVLSVNVVLSAETTALIDEGVLARMKPTALLINSSRGPIVNEQALIDALANGRIGGAALDAFDVEPLPLDSPLRDFDNVVLTPHVGYVTDDVYTEFFTETMRSVLAYLDGAPIRELTDTASSTTAKPRRYEDPR